MKILPRGLGLIMAAHLGLGLLYSWATPIFEAPDEGYHFAVIRWMALGYGLPKQDPAQPQDWEQEGSQPPLYHALTAGLIHWVLATTADDWAEVFVHNPHSAIGIPGTTHNVNLYRHTAREQFPYHGTPLAVHMGRWLSLLFSLGTIFLTYHLARLIFPTRTDVVWLTTALVAFNPKVLFINASVNNDNLLMLLSTASLLMMVPLLRATLARFEWRAFGLGMLLGLAALTKVSGLVLWPLAVLSVSWGAWQARSWRRFIAGGLLIGVPALLISGWWFWRNQLLYGEWLGLNTMVAIAGPRVPPVTLAGVIRAEWYGFYRSFWDVFGVFTILPARWIQWVFDGFTLWALAGLGWSVLRRRARLRSDTLVLALFCWLTLAGVIRWTMLTPASQGRLMFGAIAPLSLFMAVGLLAPFARRRLESWILSLGIFLVALLAAIIPVTEIAPHYAPSPYIIEAQLPANMQTVRVRFGGVLELVGYTWVDTPVRAGASQSVTVYWRVLQLMPRDLSLALHVFGRGQSAEVGKLDTWPGGGLRPTSQIPVGSIFADRYAIPTVASAEAPSVLWLVVDVWDAVPENKLPIATASGPTPAVVLRLGRVIPAQPLLTRPARPLTIPFEYGITLLGIDSGPNGAFTLYWQTTQPIPGDYTVFVHLLDTNGTQVTQKDSPPLNGDWPTSAWIPNLAFADPRLFDVTGLRPGQYTLRLGFYEPTGGARLAAFQPDGTRWPDDMVVIENAIEIK